MSDAPANVIYGDGVPGDDELHLLGDVSGGRRVIELGIAGNAVALAALGAKAIAVDPDEDRIADLRGDAARAGVSVECHRGELADLGFAPSGTIDLVIANHTLDDDDDLGRTLRQVHRVLKPGRRSCWRWPIRSPPSASRSLATATASARSGDLLTALARTNFRIEAFHEVGVGDDSAVPTTLVVKTRKQGS